MTQNFDPNFKTAVFIIAEAYMVITQNSTSKHTVSKKSNKIGQKVSLETFQRAKVT